jgi:hypothetical protein
MIFVLLNRFDIRSKKPVNTIIYRLLLFFDAINVGMTRFELATPRPPDVCATGLRYIPKILLFNSTQQAGAANVKVFL